MEVDTNTCSHLLPEGWWSAEPVGVPRDGANGVVDIGADRHRLCESHHLDDSQRRRIGAHDRHAAAGLSQPPAGVKYRVDDGGGHERDVDKVHDHGAVPTTECSVQLDLERREPRSIEFPMEAKDVDATDPVDGNRPWRAHT